MGQMQSVHFTATSGLRVCVSCVASIKYMCVLQCGNGSVAIKELTEVSLFCCLFMSMSVYEHVSVCVCVCVCTGVCDL